MEGKPFVSYREDLKRKARSNRKDPTPAEKLFWQLVRSKQIKGYKFHRQKPLGKYVVDFYCSNLKLVIELDGDTHAYQESYDKERTKELEANGIRVKRYQNQDVLEGTDGVYEDLVSEIEKIEKNL